MEEIITVNGIEYIMESITPLTQIQKNNVIKQLSTQIPGCTSCGGNNKIVSLAATCTRTTAIVGDVINLKARGTGGTPTYTAHFTKTGGSGTISPTSVPELAENVDGSATYTVVAADAGTSITFNGYVIDNCATGPITSTSFSCTVAVQAAPVLTTVTVTNPNNCKDTIKVGETCQLEYTCVDQFSKAISCTAPTWTTASGTGSVTVVGGLVTGVTTGTATVTATTGGKSGAISVTVLALTCITPTCGFTIS